MVFGSVGGGELRAQSRDWRDVGSSHGNVFHFGLINACAIALLGSSSACPKSLFKNRKICVLAKMIQAFCFCAFEQLRSCSAGRQ